MPAFKDFIVRKYGGHIVARHREFYVKPWKGKKRSICALFAYCAKHRIHPRRIVADGGMAKAIKWEPI